MNHFSHFSLIVCEQLGHLMMPDEPLAHAILILSKALAYNVIGMPFTNAFCPNDKGFGLYRCI